ncbi:MAG: SPFH/Band 7/PHB domain protein [Methanomicrobiales archaeon]|nr:SPFH/Band 7/PHB domain protein [Methanomicrobiales archaeon]
MKKIDTYIPLPTGDAYGLEFFSVLFGFLAGIFLIGAILLNIPAIAIIVIFVGLIFVLGIRIVRPTHRVLIEWLGKYQRYGEPGFYWIIPGIQKLYAVNITEKMVDPEAQEVITKDNLNATVNAQVYYKIKVGEEDVKRSQYNVYNYEYQIVNLAQTTLRNIIGTFTLKEVNSQRSRINEALYEILQKETDAWGIDIIRTELKEIAPPKDVQETMNKVVKAENEKIAAVDYATAVETQADGERRASIKRAEGVKQSKILEAEGEAGAIKLVNEAAEKYFIGNAQLLKKLDTVAVALKDNTKVVVPSDQQIVNVIGELAGVVKEK